MWRESSEEFRPRSLSATRQFGAVQLIGTDGLGKLSEESSNAAPLEGGNGAACAVLATAQSRAPGGPSTGV